MKSPLLLIAAARDCPEGDTEHTMVPAPISETLGAAIVMLSGYRQTRPLIDPMCGSGTMPIEAAMTANNIAPGINREFAAEDWHFLQNNAFAAAREPHGTVFAVTQWIYREGI